jgi:cytochrome P450
MRYAIRFQGTLILPNYWGANMDEAVWEDPHCFRPERFLNANGEIFNTEKILSFGIGKRSSKHYFLRIPINE